MKEKKWFGVIYVLTNLLNGKQYVGKTKLKDHTQRWDAHIKAALKGKSKHCIHLAIRKYGVESFSAEVIQHCRTLDTLNAAECRWIKKLNTLAPHGYNMTKGGDGGDVVGQMSKEDQIAFGKKVSKAQHKRYKDPAAHEVMRAGQARRFADESLKAANAAVHKTPEFRALQSDISKSKWTNKKWAKKRLAAYQSPEHKTIQATAAKQWHSDPTKNGVWLASASATSTCAKVSSSLTAWYADPTNRAKHQSAHRTEEFRAKKSDDTKAFWSSMTPDERKVYWRSTHIKRAA